MCLTSLARYIFSSRSFPIEVLIANDVFEDYLREEPQHHNKMAGEAIRIVRDRDWINGHITTRTQELIREQAATCLNPSEVEEFINAIQNAGISTAEITTSIRHTYNHYVLEHNIVSETAELLAYAVKNRYHAIISRTNKKSYKAALRILGITNIVILSPHDLIIWANLGAIRTAIFFCLALGLLITAIYAYRTISGNPPTSTPIWSLEKNSSFGNRLLSESPSPASSSIQKGVNYFEERKYELAIIEFENARKQDRNQPEALIYLNNARIRFQDAKSITIAISAPLSRDREITPYGAEMLRGAAQAQDEFNSQQAQSGKTRLTLLVVDDQNDPVISRLIAEKVVENNNIVAAIGHLTSTVTKAAIPIYQQGKMVLLSPSSTADSLTNNFSGISSNFFFRNVASNKMIANKMAKYLNDQGNLLPTIVLYSSDDLEYSKSLAYTLRETLGGNGVKTIRDFSLADDDSDLETIERIVQDEKVNSIILLPTSDPKELKRARRVALANQGSGNQLPIIGADTLQDPNFFPKKNEYGTGIEDPALSGSIIAVVPWFRSNHLNTSSVLLKAPFLDKAYCLWGTKSISWVTATTYDAIFALVESWNLGTSKTSGVEARTATQQKLISTDFQLNGVTGSIQFQPNGDLTNYSLDWVKVVPSPPNSKFKNQFESLDPVHSQSTNSIAPCP